MSLKNLKTNKGLIIVFLIIKPTLTSRLFLLHKYSLYLQYVKTAYLLFIWWYRNRIFILFIVVMVFGADKIPEIARGLGKGMRHLKMQLTI